MSTLTSHELGFYKELLPSHLPVGYIKKKKEITVSKKFLLKDYLWNFLKKRATCNEVSMSQKDIADELGVSIQTIRRKLQKLEKAGVLEKTGLSDPALKKPQTFKLKGVNFDNSKR
jgi:DNA-binding MarR family transcriptional regulator